MRRKYGENAEFDVIVNVDRGDMEIYMEREVAQEVNNPESQILLKQVWLRVRKWLKIICMKRGIGVLNVALENKLKQLIYVIGMI